MVHIFFPQKLVLCCLLFLSCFSSLAASELIEHNFALGTGLLGGTLIGTADSKTALLGAAICLLPIFRDCVVKRSSLAQKDIQWTAFSVIYGALIGLSIGGLAFHSSQHQALAITFGFGAALFNFFLHFYFSREIDNFFKKKGLLPHQMDEKIDFDID